MSRAAVNIILFAIYFCAIAYLILRYRDIKRNKKKYDIIKGYEKYEKSQWYWKSTKDFGRLEPPYSSYVVGVYCFVIVGAILIFPAAIFKDLYPPEDATYTFRGLGELLILIVPAALAFAMAYYIPMHLKSPIAVCSNIHYIFKGKARSYAWRKMTLVSLICVSVLFPIYILSFHNNGYVTDTELVYSPFFSFEDKEFRFDDIVQRETESDADGNVKHDYIMNGDGDKLDLYGIANDTEEIIRYVTEKIEEAALKK